MVVDRFVRVCPQCGQEFEMLYCRVEDYVYKEEIKFPNCKTKMLYFCSYSCRQAYRRENDIKQRTHRKGCEKSSSVCPTR